MGDQANGQAQTPPHAVKGVGRSEAVQALANHVFGGLPPSGGKFTMAPDQLNDTIKQWNDLLDQLQTDARRGQGMVGLSAAGSPLDQVGQAFVNAANASGIAYLKANKAQQDFVTEYITKLTAVRDGHVQADQDGADHLKKA
ncbi:hypothetical protein [Kutzneria sp. CA-103260]|uniref:hypothetical protein n=1 Tax=Kutzneria sp. CA-103260 TaxID=2802641 RepID=UPI001BAA467A|nr:hypothetical protein [Kutzneria sp. CA-103260]QUQ72035.1 hypothetical protein JJ691_98220 [Kutzneria sp. CA-103260]